MLVSKWQYERESDKMLFNMRLSLTADKYGNHNRGLHAIGVEAEQRKYEVMIRKGGALKSY
jgi:hypothetical protein